MFTTIKKITISIVCAAVLAAGLAVPQKTYAIPVIDGPLNGLTTGIIGTQAANWASQVAKWAKDELFKTLRDKMVKYIVDEINKQTVDWIKGKGEPKFVTDWQGFVKGGATEAINQTISQSKLADLCTPFAPQLRIALIPETRPISQTAKCTLTKIVSNVQGFYDNFANGGWLAYGEAIKPENNLYMQLVMFGDEIKLKSNLNQETKKQEAGAGSGFLSVSTCEEDNSQDLFDQCQGELQNQIAGPLAQSDLSQCYDYAASNKTCTKKKVQTPGAAVGDTVKNMIGSDNIYAAGAQSILSAVIDAGLNRMMSEGLALMSSTGRTSGSGVINPGAAYAGELASFNADANNSLKETINPTYNQWKALMDLKKGSETANDQIPAALDSVKLIQSSGVICPPIVVASDYDSAAVMAAKLTGDIAALQPMLQEAENLLARIDARDPNDITQSTAINEAIRVFTNTYIANDPYHDATAFTTAKQAAIDEQAGINKKLSDVQAQKTQCQDPQTAWNAAIAAVQAAEANPSPANVTLARSLANALPANTGGNDPNNKNDLVARANNLPL